MELMNYLWSIWILYGFFMELIGTPRLESYDSYDLRDRNEEASLVRSSASRRDPELGADHIFVQHSFSIC